MNRKVISLVNRRGQPFLLLLIAAIFAVPALASDSEDLRLMLDDFLANVSSAETHDRLWADDLIYTSSSGTRTKKSDIMAGFNVADNSGDDNAPGPVFTAEEVQIQVYGETAVVAFKLVATPPAGSEVLGVQQYFNTGTFVKRSGEWRAVAWQATIILESVDE